MGNRLILPALAAVLLLPTLCVLATTVTVKVKVLVPLPCIINSDKPIVIDFGNEVMTTRVDGSNYMQPIKYSVTCTGQTTNAMKLSVQGTGAAFNTSVLQTNNGNLGVEIHNGGSKFSLNSWLNFTYPTLPVLSAVPVKKPGATLTAGAFSAAAIMMVDYQ